MLGSLAAQICVCVQSRAAPGARHGESPARFALGGLLGAAGRAEPCARAGGAALPLGWLSCEQGFKATEVPRAGQSPSLPIALLLLLSLSEAPGAWARWEVVAFLEAAALLP